MGVVRKFRSLGSGYVYTWGLALSTVWQHGYCNFTLPVNGQVGILLNLIECWTQARHLGATNAAFAEVVHYHGARRRGSGISQGHLEKERQEHPSGQEKAINQTSQLCMPRYLCGPSWRTSDFGGALISEYEDGDIHVCKYEYRWVQHGSNN